MGNPKGVERDFDSLERRRLKAARLFDRGLNQGEVSRQLGVHRQSVSRWHQAWQKQGAKALLKAGRAGRKARLQPSQLQQLSRGLKEGPEVLGYGTSLWTTWRVADLIERQTGQKLSSRACVANSALFRLELPTTHRSGHAARRTGDPALETGALAGT
jgi:transposase